MSKRKEKISAFLDNDMHRDELMSFSLSAEADDAKVAQRYQMVGDALRGEMSNSSFVDVSQAVREALADENIAEQMTAPVAKASSKPLHEASAEKSGFFDLSGWFKPVAGMAVAASVAVVMVVTVTGQDTGSVAPMASNNDTQLQTQPVAVQLAAEDKATNRENSELDAYINQHLEFATQDTLQGRLPYVRAVSFESNGNAQPSK